MVGVTTAQLRPNVDVYEIANSASIMFKTANIDQL